MAAASLLVAAGAAAILSLAFPRAAQAQSGLRVEAGYMFDDNVFRARDGGSKHSDSILSLSANKEFVTPLFSENARALLGGFVGAEKFLSRSGLDHVFGGVRGELQYRPSGEYTAPTFALLGRLAAEQYDASRRSGSRYSLGVSVLQPLTDRIVAFGALAHEERRANSAVFNAVENSGRVNLDYSLTAAITLYLGGEYRRGDIVSSGPPALAAVDIAKVLVRDDAFPEEQIFAYRFSGETVIATLGANVARSEDASFDFFWRRAVARPTLTPGYAGAARSRYVVNQLSIAYLVRF